jgi:GT2 family glycosyltransferase
VQRVRNPSPKGLQKRRSKSGAGGAKGVAARDRPLEAEATAPKLGRLSEDEVGELRGAVEKQRRSLNDLITRVDSLLLREEEIQARLYDLNLSLAALRQASPDPASTAAGENVPAAGDDSYPDCIRRVREVVRELLPGDATVIVVTRGDEDLLDLYGRRAWHFPQAADGRYMGYYPPDGTAIIAHLEALRRQGGQYLLFPKPALWWLKSYSKFSDHLHRHYPVMLRDEKTCVLFALDKKNSQSDSSAWSLRLSKLIDECVEDTGADPSILDWNTGLPIKGRFPGHAVFAPPDDERALPYLDRSIDIVVVKSRGKAVSREARRVASYAVVALTPRGRAGGALLSDGEQGDFEVTVESINAQSPRRRMPSWSIIIPTYNGKEHLTLCLASLDETLPEPFPGEVIVVDDGSAQDTQALLKEWQVSRPHLKVVRNARNRGFLVSCNRGARAANGDILIFLNDDTMPQKGWLQALLRIFRDHPEVGAVGGRLLYPDGRLQEAGNVVFSDGSAANFGRGDVAADAPIYNHVREVDYCSASLLATPRRLFSEVGGFDERYEPGYYEDTDYCFELRKRGYRVYYQPESVVVHTEGGTGGTDLTSGAKRFQVVNQKKFARKWKRALLEQPERPEREDMRAWYALAVRGANSHPKRGRKAPGPAAKPPKRRRTGRASATR